MALIKCPECQHDVSDSAVQCPNCGFAVKDYCDKKRQIEKFQNEARVEAYEQVKRIKREEERRKAQAEIDRIREIEEEKTRKAEEEKARELKKQELERQKQILFKYVLPCFVFGTIILSAIVFYFNMWIPNKKYNVATDYMSNKQYVEAINIFVDINEYNDSQAKIFECNYQLGMLKYDSKNYPAAIDYFEKSSGYANSLDMITSSQNEIKLIELKEAIANNSFVEAYKVMQTLPDDMINNYKIECCFGLAQEYLDDSKFSQCIKILEENGLEENELYLKAQYLWAKNMILSHDYLYAINKLTSLGEYEDCQALIEECNNCMIYEQAIEFMHNGDLNAAIEKFALLGNSYNDKVGEYLTLCKQYKKYCSRWKCVKYRINNLDNRGEHNLDYTASSEDMVSKVKISEDCEVTIIFNGCKAEINGDIVTWNQYESLDPPTPNTFNLKTGAREMKFYTYAKKPVVSAIYTYKYVKVI